MRSEQEVRSQRNAMYNFAILMKQRGEPIADLVLIVVNQYDWVLGVGDAESFNPMLLELLAQAEKDKLKLAMF